MTVQRYDTPIRLGGFGTVLFTLSPQSGRSIVSASWDLIGDGLDGKTLHADDWSLVPGLRYQGLKIGTFQLVIQAIDSAGCLGSTGARRDVTVVP